MIGQKIGLPHLLPLAIKNLKNDQLAEGDYYLGDLLMSVIGAESFMVIHRFLFYDTADRTVEVYRNQKRSPGLAEHSRSDRATSGSLCNLGPCYNPYGTRLENARRWHNRIRTLP